MSYWVKLKKILTDISFEIKPGTITALIGPNGSGKTSLIRLLSGEWHLQKGVICFDEIPLHEWTQSELACRRAVLSQSIELAFDFSVMDVVMLAKTPFLQKVRPAITQQTVRDLLKWIGLSGFEKKSYNDLSGGEKKRVQIARVLAQMKAMPRNSSRYLFLDEPEAHLDLGWKLMPLKAAQKQAREGVGVVVALHDIQLAAQYADQVLLLSQGQVIASGCPETVMTSGLICKAYGMNKRTYEEAFAAAIAFA